MQSVNHLAHFHLAGDCPGHLVGALLADHLRGPLQGAFPTPIEAGVRLHRRIDAFTDTHPLVRRLKSRFPDGERRLSGIVLDLWFDHCLARHWSLFDPRELAAFGRSVYSVLREHRALLPEATRRQAERIEAHDLLPRYADCDIVEGSLERIGDRLGMAPAMRAAAARARGELPAIEAGFLAFYPELASVALETRLGNGPAVGPNPGL